MSIAAGCAAAHGHLELLKWLTVEQYEKHASGTGLNVASGACWGRYILAAAARGGHVEIIEWARRIGYATTTPGRNDDARNEWVRAGNEASEGCRKKETEGAGWAKRKTDCDPRDALEKGLRFFSRGDQRNPSLDRKNAVLALISN